MSLKLKPALRGNKTSLQSLPTSSKGFTVGGFGGKWGIGLLPTRQFLFRCTFSCNYPLSTSSHPTNPSSSNQDSLEICFKTRRKKVFEEVLGSDHYSEDEASSLSRHGRATKALSILHQDEINQAPSLSEKSKTFLKNVRLSVNNESPKKESLKVFLKSFPKESDLNQILAAFAKKMGSPTITTLTYTRLIHILSLSGDYKRSQKVFDLLVAEGRTPDEKTYVALMNAYSNGENLTKTIELFDLVRNDLSSQSPNPYAIMIKTYMQHNRVLDAFDVIKLMKQKVLPNVQVYTSLIQACIKAQDNTRAWIAYEMMIKDGVLPNEVAYNLLISICQKQDVNRALELFQELSKRGISPTHNIINSLLAALCSTPDYYPKAIEHLNFFTKQGVFDPDPFTFNTMIKGASVNKNLSDARYFFYRLLQSGGDPKCQLVSYSTMFDAYASAFAIDLAERSMDSFSPDTKPNVSFLIKTPPPACANQCVFEAMKLIPLLEKISVTEGHLLTKSCAWTSFLYIFTNYNYFHDAMKWFQYISNLYNRHLYPQLYTCMLTMCIRLRKDEAFFTILERAETLLGPIGSESSLSKREKTEYKHKHLLSPRALVELYQTVIAGLAEFGRLPEALNYFEIAAHDSAIDWKKMKCYKPFFNAIKKSSDPKLKLRLDQLI